LETLKAELDTLNNRSKIEFDTINDEFLKRFLKQHFQQGWLNPYTEKNYKLFKYFMTWATKKGYNKNLDYQEWEVNLDKPKNDDNIYYLEMDELNAVMENKYKNEKVKDCFLFQCFTGLRYSDMYNLLKSDINHENITTHTQKTHKKIKIPLNDVSKSIINKYKDDPGEKALPVMSVQKYNKFIQELGQDTGLTREVDYVNYCGGDMMRKKYKLHQKMTSHTGRKTFVTLGVYLGIPIETMIKYTGQTIDIIGRYYDIADEVKEREMKKYNQLRIVS